MTVCRTAEEINEINELIITLEDVFAAAADLGEGSLASATVTAFISEDKPSITPWIDIRVG